MQSVATVHAWAGGGGSGARQPPAAALQTLSGGQTVAWIVVGPAAQVYVDGSHGTMGTMNVLPLQ